MSFLLLLEKLPIMDQDIQIYNDLNVKLMLSYIHLGKVISILSITFLSNQSIKLFILE